MAIISSIPCFSCCGAPLPPSPPPRCNCPENYAIPSTLYITVLSEENWPCMNGLTFKMQYFASDNLGTNEEKIRFWRYTPPIEQQIIKYIPFSSILKEYPFYFREIQECGNLLFGGAPFTPRYGQCNWNAPDENCYKKLRISFLLQIDIFGCGMELFPMIWTARNEEPYCNPIEYSLPIINKAFGGLDQTYDVQFFDCQKIDYYFNWKYQSCENMGSGFLANFGATGIDKTIFLLTE